MNADEYAVCVSGGYRFDQGGRGYHASYDAEAIVYVWGGRVVARFRRSNHGPGIEAVREVLRRRAEAWIAADAPTRAYMNRAESYGKKRKRELWSRWLPDG